MPSGLGHTLLIANPAAKRGHGRKLARIAYDLLAEWLGDRGVELVFTERPGHAVEIASHASNKRYGTVLALGGDGIVHEVVNGLMQLPRADRPLFGLIPAGLGNDYARTLHMSECVPDAIVQLLDAIPTSLDVGCCNGEYFAETISFGLDAAIALDTVQRRERTGQEGAKLYLLSGIDQLLHHLDTYAFDAVLDGERSLNGLVHMMAVQIGQTYGGGFRICPQADPADGLFDICYADAPMNVPEATFKFLCAKNAHHAHFKSIHFERASTVDLTFDRIPPCQVDGEPLVADSYRITVVSRALQVLIANQDGII